jgi:hypothetical protein
MFTRKVLTTLVFALFAVASVASEAGAQTVTTFVAGLKNPGKIIYAENYDVFFVSEAGLPMTTNTGRISIVGNDGTVSTLIDRLPSGPAAPNNDPSGPSAMWLDGDTLYIAISAGNAVLNGPAPGSEIPNPNPASPIFSSVLELRLPPQRSLGRVAYQIEPADHARLAGGETLDLGSGNSPVTLRMTANFPDYTPNFRPGRSKQRAFFKSVRLSRRGKQALCGGRVAKSYSDNRSGERTNECLSHIRVACESAALRTAGY